MGPRPMTVTDDVLTTEGLTEISPGIAEGRNDQNERQTND
jgi:hypothetical protein